MDNKNTTLQKNETVNFQTDKYNQIGWYLAVKEDMYRYRERRHSKWDDNYMLYRDEVRINRITQRQSVNIPLMKYTVRTLLKDIDDAPALYFHNLSNDSQKELFYNTFWEETMRYNRLVIKDIADKKANLLYGRTFKSLGITGGRLSIQVNDVQDMLVNRYVDPTNINTARGLIHTNIFKPLSLIQDYSEYNKTAVTNLVKWFSTKEGIGTLIGNMRRMMERNNRLAALGVQDLSAPMLGETWINLDDAFLYKKDPETGREVLFYTVVANDLEILLDVPLYKILGKTRDDFWEENVPAMSWADDVDGLDFWTDGVADVMRKPNHILNAWFSQMVENRTLNNFGMTFFDATVKTDKPFNPESFEPGPFKWFGVPGDPNKILKRVDIAELDSKNMEELNFLMNICEKASAATAIQQGVAPDQQTTLGEVQLLYKTSQERVRAFKVFYDDCWEDTGTKVAKLIESAGDKLDPMQTTRKGKDGKGMYSYTISPDHMEDPYGYVCEVKQKNQKSQDDVEQIKKLYAAKGAMPMNTTLDNIFKEKLSEFAGLTPTQVEQVLAEEKTIQAQIKQMQMMAAAQPVQPGQKGGAKPSQQMQQPTAPPMLGAGPGM